MNTRTRTTEQMRDVYTDGGFWDGAEFDLWLKRVKAEVWAEGYEAGSDCDAENPYLEGEQK